MCSRKKAAVVEEILHWLDMNYELSEGVCIPRCLLYQHYLDSCRIKQCPPIGAAAFGKMVRRKFNQISTRRLGTRGQSKYHYYGLAVRPDSRYYGSSIEAELEGNRSLPSFSVFKSKITSCSSPELESTNESQESPKNTKRRKLSVEAANDKTVESRVEAAGFIMKSFPRSYDLLHIPSNIDSYELDTFLIMYKTHSERLLDSFMCDQLDNVHLYLKHFWSQIPSHFNQLLSTAEQNSSFPSNDFFSRIVETCDYLFYEALETGLIPEDLNTVSEQLVSTLTFLSVNFECWLRDCITNVLPPNLVQVKMKVLEDFVKSIRRNLSLIPLVKSCNLIVSQRMITDKMSNDFKRIELLNIIDEDIGLFDERAVGHVRHLMQFISHTFSGNEDLQFGNDSSGGCGFVALNNLIRLIKGSVNEFVRNKFQDNDESKTTLEMSNSQFTFQSSLSSILTPCVSSSEECLISRGVIILLTVGRALSSLSRELTLSNASSFGYWHLIFLLINDYSLITFESMIRKQSNCARRAAILNHSSVTHGSYRDQEPSITNENFMSTFSFGEEAREAVNYEASIQTANDLNDEIKQFIQL